MQKVIEALESRIAPAALFTYTETDGDQVTIKTSAKISNADFATYLQSHGSFDSEDGSFSFGLTDPIFRKTDLTITVEQAGAGDGKAEIGHIEANVDLRNVSIDGDLRAIHVGDSNPATAAVNKLQVENLGGEGAASYFQGDVKAVKILGDLTGDLSTEGANFNSINIAGSIKVSGTSVPEINARRIGSLVIGGDMEGEIYAGTIKALRIGGDIVGGDTGNVELEEVGRYSGTIHANVIKSARIAGSIVGGEDDESGGIYADFLGNVIVGGSVQGGNGEDSGFIWGDENLGKVVVLGSVIGGNGGYGSGQIGGYGDIGYVYVGQNLVGGSAGDSGWIGSDEGGSIDRVVIAGSIIGNGYESGRVDAYMIGSIRVGGDVVGGASERSGGISAYGIGSAYIGGNIVGGTGMYSGNVDAGGIGSIRVVGNLTGSAGFGSGSIFGYYGIESVKIGGSVTGDASGSGSVGAVDGSIESIVIGGSLTNSGNGLTGIYAGGFIGRVSITGDAIGDEYGTLGIRAGATYSSVLSIGSVNIKGNATNLLIEAGVGTEISYGEFGPEIVTTGVTAGATIGAVTVGGNFTTSSIAASVNAGDDGFYGTADDILPSGAPGVVSRIGSVAIGGNVAGTPSILDTPSAVDGYAIIAQHIVSAKVGGAKQILTTGASNDAAELLGATGDVRLIEVPAFLLPPP